MSWLIRDLAERAEDFLNEFDQNTAVVLQYGREKSSKTNNNPITELTGDVSYSLGTSHAGKSNLLGLPLKKPSRKCSPPRRKVREWNDEELINYLNSPQSVDPVVGAEQSNAVKNGYHVPGKQEDGHLRLDTVNSSDLQEDKSRPGSSSPSSSPSKKSSQVLSDGLRESLSSLSSVISKDDIKQGNAGELCSCEELQRENSLLKKEVRSLNYEISQLHHRTKDTEETLSLVKDQLGIVEEQATLADTLKDQLGVFKRHLESSEDLIQSLRNENIQLKASSCLSECREKEYEELKEKVKSAEESYSEQMSNLKKRCNEKLEDCIRMTDRANELQQQLINCQEENKKLEQQCFSLQNESKEIRDELERYRIRAHRTLKRKNRLIADLRSENSSNSLEETLSRENEKLQQEKESSREQILQMTSQLQMARDDLQKMEAKLEEYRDQFVDMKRKLDDSLQDETTKRQAAEEVSKTLTDELRSLREEFSTQICSLTSRNRERELEISRLREQLVKRTVSLCDDGIEQQLYAVNEALVQKMATLEAVTTEKTALKLQLEKMEHTHRHNLALLQRYQSICTSANETDDIKAKIPSMFEESPFDTGISRRMKRAYTSLDSVSIRTGSFLRRYPLVRVVVFFYVIFLHLWVGLVLTSSSPQPH